MFPAISDWSDAMMTSLAAAMAMLFAAIPKVLAFALILVVGWLLSGLIARGAAGLLRAVKFNDLAERSGFAGFIRNTGMHQDASGFLALLAKWFLRLIALVVAFDALGLPAVSDVLRQLLLWLPNLAVGVVVLVAGGLLANGAHNLVRGATASAGLGHPEAIANGARVAVWAFAIIVAVNQIGVAEELVNTLFMGAVALVVLGFGISFGLGGRELAGQLLQRWYAEGRESAPRIAAAASRAGELSTGTGSGEQHRAMGDPRDARDDIRRDPRRGGEGGGSPAHGYSRRADDL